MRVGDHSGLIEMALSRAPLEVGRNSKRLYAYLDPHTALTTLRDGHMIFVDPADEQIAPSLIVHGAWEPWIEPVIRRLVRPGERVLEVGANVGFYTLLMASLIGPSGHIDSFEANPRVARLLRRSIASNGYDGVVTVHEKIAADRNGVMTFSSSVRSGGAGGIFENGREFGSETCFNEVEALKLDDAFDGQSFDFIRTDAEGSEILILDGAMEILERSASIKLCVEWSPFMMRRRGDVETLAKRLEAMRFKFWRISNPFGLNPNPLTAAEVVDLDHCDLVIARELTPSMLRPAKMAARFLRWALPRTAR